MRDEKTNMDGVQEMGKTEEVQKEQGAEQVQAMQKEQRLKNIQDLQDEGLYMTETDAEEFARMVREEAMDLNIPEKLRPENIRKDLEDSGKVIKLKRRRKWMRFAAGAAVVVLLAGGGRAAWNVHRNNEMAKRGTDPVPVYEQDDAGKSGEDAANGSATGTEADCLVYAGSYDAVEDTLKEIRERREKERGADKDLRFDIAEEESTAATNDMETSKADSTQGMRDSGTKKSGSASTDHSETNLQVQGVDEADVVKTDGEYIYRLREQAGEGKDKQILEILKADGKKIQKAGEYIFDSGENVSEFYLQDEMLIAICHGTITVGEYIGEDVEPEPVYEESADVEERYAYMQSYTKALFIDIHDKKNPAKKNELTQTGSCVQSRVSDGYLYIVTGENAYRYTGERNDINIPCLEETKVSADSIYIPDGADDTQFTTVASVDLANTSKYQDSRTILVNSQAFYMTTENIYLYNTKYAEPKKGETEYTNHTEITKFHYNKGKFSGKATAQVDGVIKDTFAIDEYDGKLRVLTSVSHIKRTTIFDDLKEAIIGYRDDRSRDDNMVYVLDDGLKVLGSISGIAEDERIYSARFQGDIGYFVTYRETDPLFTVDFSNPAKPKVIGELKIPGFSEYLHFYSDGLLLGIGQEDDEGKRELKLSMFDISDPTKVKEVDKYIIKDMDYSTALYNYKAVLIDPAKNIIGFGGENYNYDRVEDTEEWGYTYNVYSYSKNKGFERKIRNNVAFIDEYEYYASDDLRGLYIGDYIYVVSRYYENITVYSMKNWKKAVEYTGEKK